jgi:hypothetical protein
MKWGDLFYFIGQLCVPVTVAYLLVDSLVWLNKTGVIK